MKITTLKERNRLREDPRKYTKQFTLDFARHCMLSLMTRQIQDSSMYGEISSYDLYRINDILREFEKLIK